MGDSMTDIATAMKQAFGDNNNSKKGKPGSRDTVPPVAVKQLADMLGSYEKAGEALGLASSSVSSILSNNKTSKPVEMLATMLLAAEGKQVVVKRNRLMVMRVPDDKREAVTHVMTALNIRVWDFAE